MSALSEFEVSGLLRMCLQRKLKVGPEFQSCNISVSWIPQKGVSKLIQHGFNLRTVSEVGGCDNNENVLYELNIQMLELSYHLRHGMIQEESAQHHKS